MHEPVRAPFRPIECAAVAGDVCERLQEDAVIEAVVQGVKFVEVERYIYSGEDRRAQRDRSQGSGATLAPGRSPSWIASPAGNSITYLARACSIGIFASGSARGTTGTFA